MNANSVDVRNSIIASHAQGIVRNAGTVTANFNLFHDNGVDVQGASITNANVVTGAPDFVDPASDDYHLSIGSAALDAGPDMGAIVDFDGESRPQGAGFDLGYDELSLGAPTGCPVTPAASCGAAASDALQVAVGADPAKSKLTLKHCPGDCRHRAGRLRRPHGRRISTPRAADRPHQAGGCASK